jgi:DNA-binding transcriptional MerR regulator
MHRQWITPAQAATTYGVHPKSLARWADDGVVEVRKTPGGHRRYSVESLETALGIDHIQAQVDRAAINAVLRGVAW